MVDLHKQQLHHLRNVNIPVDVDNGHSTPQEGETIDMAHAMEIACGRYVARRGFAMPATTSFLDDSDNGPFTLFNSDFCLRNILLDPKTAKITAIIDVEYTNTIPSAFARDPPLWLLPWPLEKTLEMGLFPWWMQQYECYSVDRSSCQDSREATHHRHAPHTAP